MLMHVTIRQATSLLLMATALLASGCSSTPNWVVQGGGFDPEWISKESDDFDENKVEALYGVGSAQAIPNISLSWEIAENRARAQVARIFQTQSAYAMNEDTTIDFDSTTTEPIRQDLTRKVSSRTATMLSGVRLVDRYYDEETGTYWVLVKLPHKYIHDGALINDGKKMSAQLEEAKVSLATQHRLNPDLSEWCRAVNPSAIGYGKLCHP